MQIRIGGLNIYIGRDKAPRWADELEGRIIKQMREHMAKIEDKMAELNATLTEIGASVTGVQDDVASLIAKVEELQNSNGGEMTEEQTTLVDGVLTAARAIKDRLAALDALNPATGGEVEQPQPDA